MTTTTAQLLITPKVQPQGRAGRYPAQVGVHLDTDQHEVLAAEAKAVGLPVAAMARVLILDALRLRRAA